MSLLKKNSMQWPAWSDLFNDDWFEKRFTDSWSPAINVSETEAAYELEVAAPGLKKDEFQIHVENKVLTISGNSSKESEEKDKNYTRREFSSRSFSRSFTLPENVDENAIKANHADGILKLSLAKTESAKPQKKEVQIH